MGPRKAGRGYAASKHFFAEKILPQGEFTSPEDLNFFGVPRKMRHILRGIARQC